MLKYLDFFLQYNSRKSLLARSTVRIHSSARVNFRRIRFRPDSRIEIGEGSMVEGSLVAEREGASIVIGRNTSIGNSILASALHISVGDDVLVSWGCSIVDHNSHAIAWEKRKNDVREWYFDRKDWTHVAMAPVSIGNKCWIGLNVIILKGVEIGEGSVVGAGSVVTRSIPAWSVAAGNPARVLRKMELEERAPA
jgi:galactoside O-acetyltransferase